MGRERLVIFIHVFIFWEWFGKGPLSRGEKEGAMEASHRYGGKRAGLRCEGDQLADKADDEGDFDRGAGNRQNAGVPPPALLPKVGKGQVGLFQYGAEQPAELVSLGFRLPRGEKKERQKKCQPSSWSFVFP